MVPTQSSRSVALSEGTVNYLPHEEFRTRYKCLRRQKLRRGYLCFDPKGV